MTLPAWTEVQLAIGGALRLACGDRRGLGFFDASLDGFWRSFRAAAICYPLFLAMLVYRVSGAEWQASGVATIVIVETIQYVIAWVAYPLLVLPLIQLFGRGDRFLAFMVVYNWSQLPQIALVSLVALDGATGLLAPDSAQIVLLVATIATLVYEWYIARVALSVTVAQAMLLVIIDVVLGTGLGRVAEALY